MGNNTRGFRETSVPEVSRPAALSNLAKPCPHRRDRKARVRHIDGGVLRQHRALDNNVRVARDRPGCFSFQCNGGILFKAPRNGALAQLEYTFTHL